MHIAQNQRTVDTEYTLKISYVSKYYKNIFHVSINISY